MNKKILGVRIGTIFTAVICLAVALVFWMIVKYVSTSDALETSRLLGECCRGLL